ncbi:hypothetical protein MTO96_045216, partial [Rhipicephalus appendiculatus]
ALAPAWRAALNPTELLKSHDPALNEENCLRVLDVAASSGANTEYITREIKYTNVDPNEEFGEAFLSELSNYPKWRVIANTTTGDWQRRWIDMPAPPEANGRCAPSSSMQVPHVTARLYSGRLPVYSCAKID